MLVLLVLEASLEHLVDDNFHLLIDLNWVALILLISSLLLQLDIFLNTVVDEGLNILTLFVEIELLMRLKGESEGLIKVLKVVVNLGCN